MALVFLLLALTMFHVALARGADWWLIIWIFFLVDSLFFLVSPERTHWEGIGRVSDIGLIVCALYVILVPRLRKRLPYIFTLPISRTVFGLGAIVVIGVVVTQMRYGGNVVLALRLAREYFFYIAFFIFLSILLERKAFQRIPRLFTIVMLLICIAYILQSFLPAGMVLNNSAEESYSTFDLIPNRIYLNYMEMYSGLFVIIGFLLLVHSQRHRLLGLFLTCVFLCQAFLTQHRTLWVTIVVGIIASTFMWPRKRGYSIGRVLLALGLFTGVSIVVANVAGLQQSVVERVVQGFADTPFTEGTLTGRLVTSENYLRLLSQNVVQGVGLVHPDTGVLGTTEQTEYVSELGSVVLIFHFGIIGLLWLIWLSKVFHARVRSLVVNSEVEDYQRAILIGCYGFFAGTLFTSILNGGFTMAGGIILFSLMFAYAEALRFHVDRKATAR